MWFVVKLQHILLGSNGGPGIFRILQLHVCHSSVKLGGGISGFRTKKQRKKQKKQSYLETSLVIHSIIESSEETKGTKSVFGGEFSPPEIHMSPSPSSSS